MEVWLVIGVVISGVLGSGGVIGWLVVWRKNGRDQAARDAVLTNNQETIIARLDDDTTGLSALNEKIGHMAEHCARVSTGLTERVNTAERDIKELKRKS